MVSRLARRQPAPPLHVQKQGDQQIPPLGQMVNSTTLHALYVSDVFPAPASGGAVIIYRHLRRLVQEGWHVTVAAPAPSFRPLPDGHGFELRALPKKKWWP